MQLLYAFRCIYIYTVHSAARVHILALGAKRLTLSRKALCILLVDGRGPNCCRCCLLPYLPEVLEDNFGQEGRISLVGDMLEAGRPLSVSSFSEICEPQPAPNRCSSCHCPRIGPPIGRRARGAGRSRVRSEDIGTTSPRSPPGDRSPDADPKWDLVTPKSGWPPRKHRRRPLAFPRKSHPPVKQTPIDPGLMKVDSLGGMSTHKSEGAPLEDNRM